MHFAVEYLHETTLALAENSTEMQCTIYFWQKFEIRNKYRVIYTTRVLYSLLTPPMRQNVVVPINTRRVVRL